MNERGAVIFPRRLRALREKRRISRRVLSELCGLSRSAISRYERGERMPAIDDAVQIADFFGVSLDYLMGREKDFESVPVWRRAN